jgi:TolB-like protein/tetratricopeptide (TPR) repeat protein
MPPDEVAFGPFQLDLGRRQLSRDGTPVQLGGRALDLLMVLAAADGSVVTKDQLMAQVWPGAVVDENNIQVHISALRKALDDGGGAQRYVRTVQGRGYRLVGSSGPPEALEGKHRIGEGSPIIPERPSIAILPFANLSNDPEQEYFADGVVEDITVAVSRIEWLLVIARNSSFTYKGRAVDVKQVGRDLGVRYVLEGSVRKTAGTVRITAQLIDAATGAHLWADRFDGGLEGIFSLQDEVSNSVVGTIARKLEQSEIERATTKPTENLNAYDYLLRGKAHVYNWTRESISEALRLFYRAIELDPHYASAYGMAAWCYTRRKAHAWVTEPEQETAETARVARRAVELAKDDAVALCTGGFALARAVGDLDAGAAFIDRALKVNPNLAMAWLTSGWLRTYLGEPDLSIKHLSHAMRLSPLDPLMFGMHAGLAFAHFFASRYDEAASWAEKALHEQPGWTPALRTAAASYALAGRKQEAQEAMARLRQLAPEIRITRLKDLMPLRRPEDLNRFTEGLRKAGLPE